MRSELHRTALAMHLVDFDEACCKDKVRNSGIVGTCMDLIKQSTQFKNEIRRLSPVIVSVSAHF